MPDFQLDDKQLKQLDGNIKQMISAGASQDDVMRYASDFKNQFGVKKKDQIGVGTGELSSPIPSKLPSKGVLEQGLEFAQKGYKMPISEAILEDVNKKQNTGAALYNTLVGSVKRLAGGTAYTGEVLFGGRPETAITRLASAENARQKTEQFVEKARSEKASKQFEETMGKYDFTPKPGGNLLSGVDADDFKALAFTAPSQALDMVLGGLTYGSSFVAQSVSDAANELNQSESGSKMNEAQKATYIFTQAAVQAALEKVSLDLILKNTGLGKAAKQKIANEVADEFVKKGIKATAKDIEEAAFKKASTFANKAKRVGVKAAAGIATEGTTEGTQTAAQEGIKLLTNKIVDKEVFNEDDIIANLGKNIINASVGGAAFGGVAGGGVGVFQNTNKAIRNEIANAENQQDFENIKNKVNELYTSGDISDQEAKYTNDKINQYAKIAESIPSGINPDQKYKIIGGIEQKDALEAKKIELTDEMNKLDPVFRKEKQDQIDLIQAKINETNDYLEGVISGEESKYKERNGNYYKIDSNGEEVKISKENYDLAKAIKEEDKRKETAPAVIMPEENVAPEVVNVENVANVVTPEQNVPGEAIEISAKDAVIEKPKLSDKLASFKEKYNLVSDVALKGMETKKVNQEAAKIVPMDKESAVLAWLAGKDNQLNWKAINEAAGRTETARLNVGKDYSTQEVKLRDYASKERNKGLTLRDAAHKIWEDVSKRNPNITSDQVEEALLTAIRENPSRSDAARNLISISGAETAPVSIEEGEQAYYERKGEEAPQEGPISLESGFVPFQEEEGLEEAPFAVQERAAEEVNDMKDIVKDLVEEGVLNLNTIKNRVSKELGYDSKRLRETVSKAYQEYTKESTPKEVTSGVIGKVGSFLSDIFGGKAKDRVFVAKDGKSLMAKYAQISETGGRVEFQATLPNGEKVTAKPVDASVVNGFYSPLELQINQMKQDKMPAKQWLDKLRGEEAKWTGLSDWLSQQEGSLTKDNIKNWLQDNQIEINEIIKGNKDITNEKEWDFRAIGDGIWMKTLDNGDEIVFDASEGSGTVIVFVNSNEIGIVNYNDRSEIFEKVLDAGYINEYLDGGLSSTKYSKYTLDGEKQDYKEILITYPTGPNVTSNVSFDQWNMNRRSWGEKEGTLEEYKKAGILYKSNHFDEKNILVHVRSDIRTDSKGNKIFFIEEVQSDWGQQGKREGFTDASFEEIQRYNDLKSLMPVLEEGNRNANRAVSYAYKYDPDYSSFAEGSKSFYKLSIKARKELINNTHEIYQNQKNKSIAFLEEEIDKRNKKISDNTDQILLLEEEELKYDKALRNSKNNKVVIDGKEIDLNIKKEYDAYNNKLIELDKKIKDLSQASVLLELDNGGDKNMINNLERDKSLDNFDYDNAITFSELTFDENEYSKIIKEYQDLTDKIEKRRIKKAPFVTKTNDWAKLGLKVALKNAVQAGADKIAWTNGGQQNERYDLSKEVDYIRRIEKDENTFYLDISLPRGMINLVVDNDGIIESQKGSMLSNVGSYVGKSLSDLIGKDVADRVLSNGDKTYAGENLKIGGKGMIGFYGSPKDNSLGILGDLAKSLYKQSPEKIILDSYREEKLKSLQDELDEHTANKTNDFRFRDFWLSEGDKQNADFYEKRAMQSAEYEESVLREIKRLGVEYQYSINITPELKAQVEVGLPLFMSTPDGADVLGFTFGNKIYLNGEKLNPNTPIHEAGHIWTEWVKQNDPKVYERGIELVKNSDYLKEVKSSKFYQDQAKKLGSKSEIELYYQHEALAMAIGDKGAQFVTESKRASFKDWLNELWSKIKSIAGFRDITPEELQDLTFEQFTQMAVKDILGDQFESRPIQEAYDMLPQGKKLRQNKEKILIKNNFENIVNELIKKKKIQKIC